MPVATSATRTDRWRTTAGRCATNPSGLLDAIAGTAHRDDADPRVRQLRAEPAHLDVDRVRTQGFGLVGPRVLGDRLAVHDGWRAPEEDLHDAVLGRGEGDLAPVRSDRPSHRIELEAAGAEDRRVDAAGTSLERAHAREQLTEVERLHQVVVGAGVETADAVRWRVARGEHQDGRGAVVPSCPADDVDPLSPGHPPVDDGDVVRIPAQLVDRIVASCDLVHVVAGVRQAEDQDLAKTRVIFGDEHSHRRLLWSTLTPAAGGSTRGRRGRGARRLLRDGRTWRLDQPEREHRARVDGHSRVGQQCLRDAPGTEDRVAPVIERDHLREQLGAGAVPIAADAIDRHRPVGHAPGTAGHHAALPPASGARHCRWCWCAAKSRSNTRMALCRSPAAPSGWWQAPRPTISRDQPEIRIRSSWWLRRSAMRAAASAIARSPKTQGPHCAALWPAA